MAFHLKIGKLGEELACGYLKESGYKLVERNWGKKFGEIDIIAINTSKILVFVEVKTIKVYAKSFGDNSANLLISPEDNLTKAKLIKLKKICEFYANLHPELVKDAGWRIDLVAVVVNEKKVKVRHYKNIGI
ncbi:MAG: hypothetical protein A2430_00650 [Candidatus Liptonbacteria bacterium RIFOXYC1_FULL_36_8]|uniref:UPF0102 protein A2390_00830 n=3 Tax=Candidatus Liptoniibacteriota TaxID=1817909 RepID=A0A1G2CNK5_9BACT|nr:MAG: hypothetical protein A2390_00830 [Candidatus Liptonbacteria bacterium RIFOXYB1_FULL_36_10]OGZ02961.1 MAG: hypothetical protein A2430_00650 [Candidatus Liptonbacteria bacterium RIFOXYC1_FULL_36_8]OGZ03568.1 MAG: hypothetical protein A2604_00200 [Candidatus Liptonbacteria bacterium RIFOXYD1_FULL_36_11]